MLSLLGAGWLSLPAAPPPPGSASAVATATTTAASGTALPKAAAPTLEWPKADGARIKRLGLVLPTKNQALFSDKPENYFQAVERNFEGRMTYPWEGGQYGFVRNPLRTKLEGIVYTKFHEGMDIRPMERDAKNEPADIVGAIANGTVVHCFGPAHSSSSYGKYIIIEHDWGYGTFYSLYGHLARLDVQEGQAVTAGQPIALMGWTGNVGSRERAHLHLEINLMISKKKYEAWDKALYASNPHEIYSGLNLIGLDVPSIMRAAHQDPDLTLIPFVRQLDPAYKVRVPKTGEIDMLSNYPWLQDGRENAASAVSWELTFSRSGVPISMRHSLEPCASPRVIWVKPSSLSQDVLTRGRVTGVGDKAVLSRGGLQYIQLITGNIKSGAVVGKTQKPKGDPGDEAR